MAGMAIICFKRQWCGIMCCIRGKGISFQLLAFNPSC
jgi:hypothetical protein